MKRFAGLALLTALWGCSNDTTAPDTTGGLYTLTSIDNAALPFTLFSNSAGSDEVTSGTVELQAQSRVYRRVLNYRVVSGAGTQTIMVSGFGVYTVDASQIRFESRGGDNVEFDWPRAGSLGNNTITYAISGRTYRFQKQ